MAIDYDRANRLLLEQEEKRLPLLYPLVAEEEGFTLSKLSHLNPSKDDEQIIQYLEELEDVDVIISEKHIGRDTIEIRYKMAENGLRFLDEVGYDIESMKRIGGLHEYVEDVETY